MCIFCHHSPDSSTSCSEVTELTFSSPWWRKKNTVVKCQRQIKWRETFSDICCQDHQTSDLVWVNGEYSLIAKKGLMGPTTFDMYCLWHISLLPTSQWHEQPWLWMVDFQLILHFTLICFSSKSYLFIYFSIYFKTHYWIYIHSIPKLKYGKHVGLIWEVLKNCFLTKRSWDRSLNF